MANRTDGKTIYIDTWSSDITIAALGNPVFVKEIALYSAAAGDLLYIEDGQGNQVVLLVQETNGRMVREDFGGRGHSFNGLQIDVSDCTGLGANDLAWIYLE